MKTKQFKDRGLTLNVCQTQRGDKVAVWDDDHSLRTMHLLPSEAIRMARALLTAAERALDPTQ